MANPRQKVMSKHFEYNQLIDEYYKERDTDPNAIDACIKYCLEDIKHVDDFVKACLEEERDLGKKPARIPRIPAFERLAIIYEKQGKYGDAIRICERAIELGLDNPSKCYSPSDFKKRITKLEKRIDQQKSEKSSSRPQTSAKVVHKHRQTESQVKPQAQLEERGIPVRWINGIRLSNKSGKALYQDLSGKPVTIEKLALEHYGELGFTGLHSENDYWWTIMGLLFWDVIFARLPGVFSPHLGGFPSQLQDMPQDFFTADFYPKREKLIAKRIADLTRPKLLGIQKPNIESELRATFKRYYGTPCRAVVWGKFSIDELSLAAKVLTNGQVVKILQKLLLNFAEYRSGLPDLFLSNGSKVLFAEVKSAKEQIANHQFGWIAYLQNQVGAEVEICRIRAD